MLTPQIKQSLFACRPAAVNITGRFCRSDSDKEDEINEQPCSSRSIPGKLHKAPPKRKNPDLPMQDLPVHPTTKEREGLTPVTVGLPVMQALHNNLPVMLQIFQACGKTFLHLSTMLQLLWILGYLHLLVI